MQTKGGFTRIFLCLSALALLELQITEAFKPRTLSALPSNNVSAITNTTLSAAGNVAAVLANFPSNLTGNLTGIQLPNATELLRIEQFVLNQTRPSVKSFIDGTNTTIDCVPILSQLSLSNPLLLNHTVTTVPPKAPATINTTRSPLNSNQTKPITRQPVVSPPANATSVNKTGLNVSGGCPSQTVPVPRLTVADIARFGSLQAFLNSSNNKGAPPVINDTAAAPSASNTGHEYATMTTFTPSALAPFYGIQTQFSVWQPSVENRPPPNGTVEEFSLSQVWVVGGSGNNEQTIEAGWQVDPVSYGDSNPHLFIYSTRAGYTDAACYAGTTRCPSGASTFIQNSNSVYPTIALQPSVANGNTVEYTLLVYREQSDGNWWVKLNDEFVGYYPGSLYTAIAQSASTVQAGGEIVDSARVPGAPPGLPHTKTQMGSGVLTSQPALSANTVAYHYNLQYVDSNQTLHSLDGSMGIPTSNPLHYNPACYSGAVVPSTDDNGNSGPNFFFFGGPGLSAQCPT